MFRWLRNWFRVGSPTDPAAASDEERGRALRPRSAPDRAPEALQHPGNARTGNARTGNARTGNARTGSARTGAVPFEVATDRIRVDEQGSDHHIYGVREWVFVSGQYGFVFREDTQYDDTERDGYTYRCFDTPSLIFADDEHAIVLIGHGGSDGVEFVLLNSRAERERSLALRIPASSASREGRDPASFFEGLRAITASLDLHEMRCLWTNRTTCERDALLDPGRLDRLVRELASETLRQWAEHDAWQTALRAKQET